MEGKPAAQSAFLSTLSLRRATGRSLLPRRRRRHFYPRSPCGERLFPPRDWSRDAEFLSTLSLRRATSRRPCTVANHSLFLSTLSLRRATAWFNSPRLSLYSFLSTLSLRRATPSSPTRRSALSNFYPRSPCGERP